MISAILARTGYTITYADDTVESELASLPSTVPVLPPAFLDRGEAQQTLKALLLGDKSVAKTLTRRGSAIAIAASNVLKALGMGGEATVRHCGLVLCC